MERRRIEPEPEPEVQDVVTAPKESSGVAKADAGKKTPQVPWVEVYPEVFLLATGIGSCVYYRGCLIYAAGMDASHFPPLQAPTPT